MEYFNDILSFDGDDLDFISSNDCNLDSGSYDNQITEEMFSSPEVNYYSKNFFFA